mgnify:CR=1 FL=1
MHARTQEPASDRMSCTMALPVFYDYNEVIAVILNEAHMATLTIRNLDDDLKSNLRVQAAQHGRSMEEEVRSILRQALAAPAPSTGLGQRLISRFRADAVELPIPPRSLPRTPPTAEAPT